LLVDELRHLQIGKHPAQVIIRRPIENSRLAGSAARLSLNAQLDTYGAGHFDILRRYRPFPNVVSTSF
jgi:hypothetical protein